MKMTEPTGSPRAWLDVDLSALLTNARTIAGRSRARLLPMVKANGYGVGAVMVSRALEQLDPWGFGVATVEEGAELRAAGISRPIAVFSPLPPGTLAECAAHDLRPTIGDLAALAEWRASGRPFHLEIDTGMSRAGFRWSDGESLMQVARLLDDAPGWEGVFTQFHSADTDPAATAVQWDRFQLVLQGLPRRPPLVHVANSAAGLMGDRFPGDLVRAGIFLYGGNAGGVAPAPVASLRTRVIATRRVRAGESVSYGATWTAPRDVSIATLAFGYADGVPRALSSIGHVEVAGRRCPIRGRVTMDMTLVESDAEPGEVATLFGGDISLDQQAAAANSISYVLLTSVAPRVERRYHGRAG